MNFLEFHYKGLVVPKPRMTRADAWKKRPIVERYWQYKDNLREQADKVGYTPGDTLDIMFSLKMPSSWSKKKKLEYLNKPHKQRSDIDNLVKGFLDCLLPEDSHVWNIRATKYWGYEDEIFVFKSEEL